MTKYNIYFTCFSPTSYIWMSEWVNDWMTDRLFLYTQGTHKDELHWIVILMTWVTLVTTEGIIFYSDK